MHVMYFIQNGVCMFQEYALLLYSTGVPDT